MKCKHFLSLDIFLDDAGDAIECCSEDGSFPRSFEDPALCFPIRIPDNDRTLGGSRTCINFVRSVCSLTFNCLPGPIEQVSPQIQPELFQTRLA